MIAARSIAEALGEGVPLWAMVALPLPGAQQHRRNAWPCETPEAAYRFAVLPDAAVRRLLAELHRRGLIDKAAAAPDPAADEREREANARDRAKRIAAARWIWDETEAANWLIETYLGGRLILCPIPETIRLYRSLTTAKRDAAGRR